MDTAEVLLKITSEVFSIPDIKSNRRQIKYIQARALIYRLLRNNLYMTFQSIGNVFEKNHATVMHAYNEFPYMLKHDPTLEEKYSIIKKLWLGEETEFTDKKDIEYYKKQNKILLNQNILLNSRVTLLELTINKLENKPNEDHNCNLGKDSTNG